MQVYAYEAFTASDQGLSATILTNFRIALYFLHKNGWGGGSGEDGEAGEAGEAGGEKVISFECNLL